MSVFQVRPTDMARAAGSVADAAESARGRGSSAHLATAAAALPGSLTADLFPDLGSSWDDDVDGWAEAAAAFGRQVAATGDDAEGTDAGAGASFGGLLGLLGGG